MESGKVYTFKLITGEEIIAKVVNNSGHGSQIEISDPVTIAPANKGITMIPTLFTVGQGGKITLNISSVAIYSETEDSITDKYIEATTGIKLPDKKIIMG